MVKGMRMASTRRPTTNAPAMRKRPVEVQTGRPHLHDGPDGRQVRSIEDDGADGDEKCPRRQAFRGRR